MSRSSSLHSVFTGRESGSVVLVVLVVVGFIAAGVFGTLSYIQHTQIQQHRNEMEREQSDLKKRNDSLQKQLRALRKEKEDLENQLLGVQMELNKEEVSNESLQRQMEEQKERIAELQSELQKRDSEVKRLNDSLVEKERAVERLKEVLSTEKERLRKVRTELTALREATKSHDRDVTKVQSELAKVKSELEKARSELADTQKRLKMSDEAKKFLQTQMEAKDARIRGLMDMLKERDAMLEKKNSEITSLRETLGQKSVELKEVQALKDTIRVKDEEIESLKEQLREKSDAAELVGAIESELNEKTKELEDLKAKLKETEEKLKKAMEAKAGDAARLQVEVLEKEKELKALRETLDKVAEERDNLLEDKDRLLLQLKRRKKEEERFAKEFAEELRFLVGPQSTRGDMDIAVSTKTLAGTKVDLARTLDMELDKVSAFAEFYGMGRFGFSLRYFRLSYSGSTTLTESLDFAGMSASAGDTVKSKFSSFQFGTTLHLNLGSLLKSGYKRVDLGVFAGARYIKCTGKISNITTGKSGSDALSTLLPFAGLRLSYSLGTDVDITVRALGMAYSYDEYTSDNFIECGLGISLKLTRLFSVEAGYIVSNMHYRFDSADTDEAFIVEHSYEGPYFALVAVF